MPLAGNEYHILRGGAAQHTGDGLCTVRLDFRRRAGHQALPDLRQDGEGVFAAGVVAGQHHPVSPLLRHAAHQGALASIAVTAAAKHTPELAATLFGHGAQGLQCLVQRIGRVGVVHGHQRLATTTGTFHASRHRLQLAAGLHGSGQRHTQCAHGGEHAQQIGHVVLPDQPGFQQMGLVLLPHRETQALRAQAHVQRLQPGRLVQCHSPLVDRAICQHIQQRG